LLSLKLLSENSFGPGIFARGLEKMVQYTWWNNKARPMATILEARRGIVDDRKPRKDSFIVST
jgi:hypothetical protein